MYSSQGESRLSRISAKRTAILGIATLSTMAIGVPAAFAATAPVAPAVALGNMYGYVIVNADSFTPNTTAKLTVKFDKTTVTKDIKTDAKGHATISFPAPTPGYRGTATASVVTATQKISKTATIGGHSKTSVSEKKTPTGAAKSKTSTADANVKNESTTSKTGLKVDSTSSTAKDGTKSATNVKQESTTSKTGLKDNTTKTTVPAAELVKMESGQVLGYTGAMAVHLKPGTSCKFDAKIGTLTATQTVQAAPNGHAAAVFSVPTGYKGSAIINATCGDQKFTKTLPVTAAATKPATKLVGTPVAKASTPVTATPMRGAPLRTAPVKATPAKTTPAKKATSSSSKTSVGSSTHSGKTIKNANGKKTNDRSSARKQNQKHSRKADPFTPFRKFINNFSNAFNHPAKPTKKATSDGSREKAEASRLKTQAAQARAAQQAQQLKLAKEAPYKARQMEHDFVPDNEEQAKKRLVDARNDRNYYCTTVGNTCNGHG